MNKKKIALVVLILMGILANVLIIKFGNQQIPQNVRLNFQMKADKQQVLQVYYGEEKQWSEEQSATYSYTEEGWADGYVTVPVNAGYIRLDMGQPEGTASLKDLSVEVQGKTKVLDLGDYMEEKHSMKSVEAAEGVVDMEADGDDPYVVIAFGELDVEGFVKVAVAERNGIYKPLMCVVLDAMLLVFCLFYEKLFSLPKELYQNRRLIVKLAKNDFKTRYAGSYLGIFWAFVQPVVTVLVYWFVFQVGFRSGSTQDCPFVLWLVSGLVPWFFFQEALIGGTNSMMEYSYLVKKVVFKISVLPIVKICSAIFVHLFFIGFTCILFMCYGYFPGLHIVQLVYYLICMFVFVLAISYMTCAIVVFFKDLSQIINIILQVGVWMTPIMWDYTMLTDPYPIAMWILKANPMFYVVQGYRNAFISGTWFWEDLGWTIYFWAVTGVLFALGGLVFKRLKPHFADVL